MPRPSNNIAQDRFIAAFLENGGQKKKAAIVAEVSEQTVQNWFNKDRQFAGKLTRAKSQWREMLHAAGMRRALAGSDRLIEFFLTAYESGKFDPGIRRLRYEKKHKIGQFAEKDKPAEGDAVPQRIVLVREPLPQAGAPPKPQPDSE